MPVVSSSWQRNVDCYPWYRAATEVYAWIPVTYLYFSQFVTLTEFIQLEALYYSCVVMLEVPSGYFSDRVGRRITLLVGTSAFIVAYAVFLMADGFVVLVIGQCFLAMAFAFQSGTDTAFHFDSLTQANREHEYAHREARAERIGLTATAVAVLAGGLAAMVDLRLAYLLSLLAAVSGLFIAARFTEPMARSATASFGHQLLACSANLREPVLAWFFLFSIVMYGLAHVPYEFYQPYITLLDIKILGRGVDAPLVSGVVIGISMFGGAFAAGAGVRWQARFGLPLVLIIAAGIQCAIIAGMALLQHVAVLALVFLRNFPSALMHAPSNAIIVPHLVTEQRATYLSLQSLAGRLTFAALLWWLSLSTPAGETLDWDTLSAVLSQSLLAGAAGLALLFVFSRAIRES